MPNNIAGFRKRKRITQKALANKLGVSNSAISEIECRKRNPTYEQALLLTEMDATLEELFGVEYAKKMLKNSEESLGVKVSNDDLLRDMLKRIENLEAKNRFREPPQEDRTLAAGAG